MTGEQYSYTNWGPLEPFNNGDRLGLYGYRTLIGSTWNDVPDRYLMNGYIVESSAPVPEPATLLLLGSGLLGLIGFKKKREG